MRTFWKILAGILILLIVLIVGVDLYFTDQRLKNTAMPYLNEAVGRQVNVDNMSLSFFSTFPHPGLEINHLSVPGEAPQDTLLSLRRMVVGVKLFPLLFNDKLDITELVLDRPKFTYVVRADSSTNIDFLLNREQADSSSSAGYDVNIPYFQMSNGMLGYRDSTSNTSLLINDLDGDLSLNFADSVTSDIDLEIGGLSATVDSLNYVNGLPVTLTESSTFYPDREVLKLQKGSLAISGLDLNLTGALSNWSKAFTVDLQFESSSNDFGDLLRLVPKKYADYTENLETKGSLKLGGTISGVVTNDSLPHFDVQMKVTDGYLKDPDLPQPIKNIQLRANATNTLITVDTLNAVAGANNVTGSGKINDPLAEDGTFNMDFVADVDLSTVHQFYDLSESGVEKLAGRLDINANARGRMDQPEKATFDGKAILADGMLKYQKVSKPITNININVSGTQDLLSLKKMTLQAGPNSFSAEGKIEHLLNEKSRRINQLNTHLQFNLATLKDFYPMDEDTLKLAGTLRAQATLNGKASPIEQSVQSGNISLKNGLVDYKEFDKPFRDISFEAMLDGPRMTIVNTKFATGDNKVQASGVIDRYLSENRSVNLKTQGKANLQEITHYYDLKPDVKEMSGDADFNLSVKGPLNTPSKLQLSGKMTVINAAMNGESLREPIKDLNGTFNLTPQKATLNNLTFNMGESDFEMSGSLSRYMAYLQDENKRKQTPQLTGQYRAKYLNLDQLIDWSDTTSTFDLSLPDLNSSLQADIDRMKIAGATMRNLHAKATTSPSQVNLSKAHVELFEGKADGTLTWEIPQNKPSTFHFKGALDSLRLESFFKQYPILGEDSQFYKYISGVFSTSVDYTTKIDQQLNPLIASTLLNGTFGMSKARVENHPLQKKIAGYTKINQLNDIALDNWQSTLSVKDNTLSINDLSLTSDNIGLQLSGTQQLDNDKIDFHVSLRLPGRFKSTIASVITSRAADAMTRDDGTLSIPLRVTGNYSNPVVQPDQTIIKAKVKQSLKNKAGNVLKNLFDRGKDKDKTKTDSLQTDTTSNK